MLWPLSIYDSHYLNTFRRMRGVGCRGHISDFVDHQFARIGFHSNNGDHVLQCVRPCQLVSMGFLKIGQKCNSVVSRCRVRALADEEEFHHLVLESRNGLWRVEPEIRSFYISLAVPRIWPQSSKFDSLGHSHKWSSPASLQTTQPSFLRAS